GRGGAASAASTAHVINPTLTTSDVSVSEGDDGTVNAVFIVTLSDASSMQVSVGFATEDGTATLADGDYLSTNGTLVFAPGETVKTIAVPVNGDRRAESDEMFTLRLSNPSNASLVNDHATATIVNDDGGAGGSGACGACGGGALLSSTLCIAV